MTNDMMTGFKKDMCQFECVQTSKKKKKLWQKKYVTFVFTLCQFRMLNVIRERITSTAPDSIVTLQSTNKAHVNTVKLCVSLC